MRLNKVKLLYFIKLASSTFMIQGLIQFMGMVIGFYIVRQLSVEQYAYYTIANTILGMMTTLSDCGVNTSVLSQGGKVWQDKIKLGKILNTGLEFRRKLSLFSMIISFPILVFMLYRNGADLLTILLITLAVIPSFNASLTESIYEIIPKLHQQLKVLQINQLMVVIFRLLLSGIALVVFPFTWVALLTNGLPRLYGNYKLKIIARKNADIMQPTDQEVAKETTRIIKRVMPGAIYFAFSGQITLFILSYMGDIANTAAWGALGRFAIVFTIFTTVISIVLLPQYARIEASRKKIMRKANQMIFLSAICYMVIVGLTYLCTHELLFLLGKPYENFNSELLLVMINSGIMSLVGLAWSLSASRGWVIHPVMDVSLSIIPLILFSWLIPLDSLYNVLIFTVYCSLCLFFGHYLMFWYQLFRKTSINE